MYKRIYVIFVLLMVCGLSIPATAQLLTTTLDEPVFKFVENGKVVGLDGFKQIRGGRWAQSELAERASMDVPACMVSWREGRDQPVLMSDPRFVRYATWAYRVNAHQSLPLIGCRGLFDFFDKYTLADVKLWAEGMATTGYTRRWWEVFQRDWFGTLVGTVDDRKVESIDAWYSMWLAEAKRYGFRYSDRTDTAFERYAPRCAINPKTNNLREQLGIGDKYCAQQWATFLRNASWYRLYTIVTDRPRTQEGNYSFEEYLVNIYSRSGIESVPRMTVDDVETMVKAAGLATDAALIAMGGTGGLTKKLGAFASALSDSNGESIIPPGRRADVDEGALRFTARMFCTTYAQSRPYCVSDLQQFLYKLKSFRMDLENRIPVLDLRPPEKQEKPGVVSVDVTVPPIKLPPELVKTNTKVVGILGQIHEMVRVLKQNEKTADDQVHTLLRVLVERVQTMNLSPNNAQDLGPLIVAINNLKTDLGVHARGTQHVIGEQKVAILETLRQLSGDIVAMREAALDIHKAELEQMGLTNDRLHDIISRIGQGANDQTQGPIEGVKCNQCRLSQEEFEKAWELVQQRVDIARARPNLFRAMALWKSVDTLSDGGTRGPVFILNGKMCMNGPVQTELCTEVPYREQLRALILLGSIVGAAAYVHAMIRRRV